MFPNGIRIDALTEAALGQPMVCISLEDFLGVEADD
jgi:hypothetical protein